MIIRNVRAFPARLLRVVVPNEPNVRAALIVKETYDVAADGSISAARDPVPISGPTTTPWGRLREDLFLKKEGVDVCVLGNVTSPSPVDRLVLRLQVGAFRHSLRVMGDRTWVRGWGKLVPSGPTPFTEMPLTYGRAFGGIARSGEIATTWPDNPHGRGLFLAERDAEGGSLPNIEDATGPEIERWDERPPVAGWAPYPANWGLSLRHCVELDASQQKIEHFTPRLLNSAHPSLILGDVEQGTAVRIEAFGTTAFAFAIPKTAPRVEAIIGGARQTVIGKLDGIFMWPNQGRVVLTYRARFQYEFVRNDTRQLIVS